MPPPAFNTPVDTRVAHTHISALTFDLDFPCPADYGHDPCARKY